MKRLSIVLLLVAAGMASAAALAKPSDGIPASLQQLTINGQALTPESVRRVELEGPIYEVKLKNGDTFYSDAQGRHMVVGRLYDNSPDGLINVTEQNDRQDRLDQLDKVPDGGTVVYPAQGQAIGTIMVFTDTTCPYCQMLHQDIDRLTAAGVTVHYVPYPRSGPDSPAARQLAQVMCSESPRTSMTSAFDGQMLNETPTKDCRSAVKEGFRLGQRFGVQGTPTIVLPNGEMGEGYMPAEQLLQAVKGAAS